MYRLHCERTIASSHQLEQHNGKCKNLHGHNFKVIVDIEALKLITGGSSDGMVMDFGDVKKVIDLYDHSHLNNFEINVNDNSFNFHTQPTAERLAHVIALEIYEVSNNPYIDSIRVRVYETDTQYAEYLMTSPEVLK